MNGHSSVDFRKMASEFLARRLGEYNLFPELRSQVAVSLEDDTKGCLG